MAFTDDTTGGREIVEGIMPVEITLTDTCEVGDLIGYDGVDSNAWERADADGKVPASLIAAHRVETSGDTLKCYKMALIESFSGATTGDPVYLSNTAGEYTDAPVTWVQQQVGECVSTTAAWIFPMCSAILAYPTTLKGLWGAHIRAEWESGVQVGGDAAGLAGGMRIDVKTISTCTVSSDIYGLYIHYQLQQNTAGSNYILRLEDNSSVAVTDAFIQCVTGSTTNPAFLMHLVGPATYAYTSVGTAKTGNGGFCKINVGGNTRYINMYTG